jgi:membrane associated rhomboid family serine protease
MASSQINLSGSASNGSASQLPEKPEFPKPNLKQIATAQLPLLISIAVMWVVQILNVIPSVDVERFGIVPRRIRGLFGIVLAPFLHVSFSHLIANTVPLAVMGAVIGWHNRKRFGAVFGLTALGSGLGVWLIAPKGTVTLGASGVVFGMLGYLLARGVFDRKFTSILIGIGALIFYGGMLFGVLPNRTGVSWQAHLFGFLAGVASAWLLSKRSAKAT